MDRQNSKHNEQRAHFEVELARIKQGPVVLESEIPLPWLSDELEACEYAVRPVSSHIKLKLEACAGGVLAKGKAQLRIATQCGTCLSDIEYPLEAEIMSYLMPMEKYEEIDENGELTPDDLEREWYNGDTVALDRIIRDAIMLELPMNPKCQGSCPGLAEFEAAKPPAGIDPRLAPLAGIKLNKKES